MTQPGGGSSSVHTFIFKTIGSAAVTGAVQSVQKHYGNLDASLKRVMAATHKNAMSAQMNAAVTAKMAANITNAEARLEAFRQKMDANTGAAGRMRIEFQQNESALNRMHGAILRNDVALGELERKSTRDSAAKRKLRADSDALKDGMAQMVMRQQELNLAIDRAIQKEKLYAASLRAREARLHLLNVKQSEAAKPLSKWEQWLATFIKINKQVTEITRTINRVTRSVNQATEAIRRMQAIWDWFFKKKGSGTGEGGVMTDLGRGAEGTSQKINIMQRSLGLLGQTAAYVFGQVIFNGLVRATQAFVGLIQQSFAAVSGFETMAISFRAIIGVQKMNADATLKLEDALSMASKESIQLIGWLEKLAIISPFSTDDVKQAFQNAISMGFNVEQAKRLTAATLDWAAANGKSGATAEHIVFVLGQMRNASKLTYQDLMQLAQMGIGMDTINRALSKSLGKTVEEITRMREAGEITASQAIPALIQYMEQFQGAAKDQANTIQGLLSSMADIGPIFMRALFGPMNEATGKIEGVVGAIQKRLQGLVEFLQSNYLQSLSVAFGRSFGQIADNALTWGENVTIQFANGLINGLWAVLDSLMNIGNLVAHWLMPGSPPRILPDIDKWGQETLNEYFRGFALADFGLFKTVADQVASTIQAAFGDDRVGSTGALMSIRERLGAAIAGSGSIGDIFAGITVPSELRQYVETMFQITEQTKVLEAAQKALNDTIKKYDELLKPVDDQLQAISDEQQNLTDDARIAQLRLIANDPNATATEKRMALLEIERLENEKVRRKIASDAKKEIDEKQKVVDAETEKLRVLEEQAALQKAFLDNQAESNRLLQDYINALEALDKKAAAGGAGGAGTPRVAAVPWGSGLGEGMARRGGEKMSALDLTIKKFVDTIKEKLAELKVIWGVVWTYIVEKLKPAEEAWAKLEIAWGVLTSTFEGSRPAIENFIAQVLDRLVMYLANFLPVAIEIVTRILTQLAIFWARHHDTILNVLLYVWNIILAIITFTIFFIEGLILTFLILVNTNWAEKWEEMKQALVRKLAIMVLRLAMWLINMRNDIAEKLIEIRDNLAEKWQQIYSKVVSTFALILSKVRAVMADVKESIAEKIEAALTYLSEVKERFVQVGKDFVQGIMDGIAAMAGALAGAIASMVGGMFGTARAEAEEHSPSRRAAREIGLPLAQGTAMGVLKGAPLVNKAMREMVGGAITPPATGRQQWGQHMTTVNNSPQFILNANMARSADSVMHEFAVMQAVYGGAG